MCLTKHTVIYYGLLEEKTQQTRGPEGPLNHVQLRQLPHTNPFRTHQHSALHTGKHLLCNFSLSATVRNEVSFRDLQHNQPRRESSFAEGHIIVSW